MKIHPECIPCLFDRAKFECDLAFKDDEEGKLRALMKVARFAGEHVSRATVPAYIGTERGRIISRESGVEDIYAELKRESNRAGEELLPIAREFYERSRDKLHALLKLAAAANSMEYGVRGHEYDERRFRGEFQAMLEERVAGDVRLAKSLVERYDRILYLLDNAGEVVVDRFVIEELSRMGKEITVSPKSKPVINDVTEAELRELGFNSITIIPSGAVVGVSLEEAPPGFVSLLFSQDHLIISKGMGNYETLSELESRLRGRLVYVLRAKCLSVAESLGVERGTLVISGV